MGDMCEGIGRMFTVSDSDGSGMNSGGGGGGAGTTSPGTGTGAVQDVGSIDAAAANRRLARLSKYFTSPVGVLDTNTGTTGTF